MDQAEPDFVMENEAWEPSTHTNYTVNARLGSMGLCESYLRFLLFDLIRGL